MALGNGLKMRNGLDDRMHDYLDRIRYLTGEVTKINKEIMSAEEVRNDLQSEGLVTPELEQSFSSTIQKSLDEKAELEEKRETVMERATQELNEAKRKYSEAVDRMNTSAGSQAAEALLAIRERVIEIGEWEKELQDAMNETDDPSSPPSKRKVLKR